MSRARVQLRSGGADARTVQCFCGNELVNGAVTAPDSDCDMACGGSATCVLFRSPPPARS